MNTTDATRSVTVSVVSHGQGVLVARLLADLARHCDPKPQVLLTINTPERLPFGIAEFGLSIEVIENSMPKGFGANHNFAFRESSTPYFCVLNPDLRLAADPFAALIGELDDQRVGVVAPRVVTTAGMSEDSARRFPTPLSLLKKLLGIAARLDYPIDCKALSPDWVAGMFMLFRRDAFEKLGGFDERYFLYYEDVDLCWRLRRLGYDVRLLPPVVVTHEAQRASRRDVRYMRLHLRSMLRFLLISRFGVVRP